MRTPTVLLILLAGLALDGIAGDGERGTPAEAKALLQKAIAHYVSAGRKQALSDFTARKPPFVDRDLYVFCFAADGTFAANGGFPELVGASAGPAGKAMWELASRKGRGSLKYRWRNPISGKTEPKVSFVRKAGVDVCGVGAYRPDPRSKD